MSNRLSRRSALALSLGLFTALLAVLVYATNAQAAKPKTIVMVPEEDRFEPFVTTVKAGSSVRWINADTDDHTIVTDDFFNTTGQNKHVDMTLPGTESNGDQPGTAFLNFGHPGVFVYYCRFHSHLDASHQPVAPGPDGGIQDDSGNYGTPMMGVVVVLPGNA
jgi:plastocyanin